MLRSGKPPECGRSGNRDPVDDSGNLTVGSACVETDTAAVHITAHGLSNLVCLGTCLQRQIQNLQSFFVQLLYKGIVELTLALGSIGCLQLLGQLGAAADGNTETADGPQQELHIALHIAVVCLRHFGSAVDKGMVNRNTALIPLNGDGNGLLCILQICRTPHAKGNEGGIQLGGMLHLIFNS